MDTTSNTQKNLEAEIATLSSYIGETQCRIEDLVNAHGKSTTSPEVQTCKSMIQDAQEKIDLAKAAIAQITTAKFYSQKQAWAFVGALDFATRYQPLVSLKIESEDSIRRVFVTVETGKVGGASWRLQGFCFGIRGASRKYYDSFSR